LRVCLITRAAYDWHARTQLRVLLLTFARSLLCVRASAQLLRLPLAELMPKDKVDVAAAAIFVREWAQLWTKPGSGLTTPVQVCNIFDPCL
jgi:hypothetical protein